MSGKRRPYSGTVRLGDAAPELGELRDSLRDRHRPPRHRVPGQRPPASPDPASAAAPEPEAITLRSHDDGRLELIGVWPPRVLTLESLALAARVPNLQLHIRLEVDQVDTPDQPTVAWYRVVSTGRRDAWLLELVGGPE